MQREIETTGMVGRASAADEQFGEIYAAHRVSLFRFAVLVAGDVQLAEEVTAEDFSRVLTRWRAGAVTEALPYLRRAIVNELRSRFRRRGHERRALQRLASGPDRAETGERALDEPLIAVRTSSQMPRPFRSTSLSPRPPTRRSAPSCRSGSHLLRRE